MGSSVAPPPPLPAAGPTRGQAPLECIAEGPGLASCLPVGCAAGRDSLLRPRRAPKLGRREWPHGGVAASLDPTHPSDLKSGRTAR